MKKRNYGYAVFTVLLVLIASFGIFQYSSAKQYKIMLNNQYHRSFSDLLDYVGNIELELKKGKAVTDSFQMTSLSSDLWKKSSFALENLSQLPLSDIELEKTAKFLSQVGDYTYSLSKKMLDGQAITIEEKQKMNELGRYANTLYHSLSKLQNDLYDGKLNFSKAKKSLFKKETVGFSDNMETVEKEFSDYPSLIYDGPFSEHIYQKKSVFLQDLPEISSSEAQMIAREFLYDKKINEIQPLPEGDGTISAYCFSVETEKEMIQIAISKKGGYPVWMLSDKVVKAEKISTSEAIESAKQFLSYHKYSNMKESYYERIGNTVLINFAYSQDNVVMYPDLIKVKVSLEDGSIVGFESNGYLMNHRENRNVGEIKLSAEEAKQIASKVMDVESQSLAIVPLETKEETLCYEFKGKIDQDEYLIYLNANNGKQEEILLLLISESGTLTV